MVTNEESLEKISITLDRLVRLEIYKILNSEEWDNKSNGEKIIFLHRMNFSNESIAQIIGTTIGTVQKEISNRKNS